MTGYRTVAGAACASFVEKKSEFIGNISPCKTEEEAIAFIQEIRRQHRRATHNCYAYILRENNTVRHSDDGEPGGTAGAPMLEVLKKEGLTDVCCVVTRYFGGIMLGAGGLVRAYTEGAKIAVDAARIKEMRMAEQLRLTLDYSLYGKIGAALSEFDVRVCSEDFAADVTLTVYIAEEKSGGLSARLTDICCGKINIESLGSEEYDFGE
ncbi:MAG: YigZ family protein [Oscillospiraceae bacterium]|nr:YigZ family protein [Oscillospiraceae bacterium]